MGAAEMMSSRGVVEAAAWFVVEPRFAEGGTDAVAGVPNPRLVAWPRGTPGDCTGMIGIDDVRLGTADIEECGDDGAEDAEK
jgi:hypothetical protein